MNGNHFPVARIFRVIFVRVSSECLSSAWIWLRIWTGDFINYSKAAIVVDEQKQQPYKIVVLLQRSFRRMKKKISKNKTGWNKSKSTRSEVFGALDINGPSLRWKALTMGKLTWICFALNGNRNFPDEMPTHAHTCVRHRRVEGEEGIFCPLQREKKRRKFEQMRTFSLTHSHFANFIIAATKMHSTLPWHWSNMNKRRRILEKSQFKRAQQVIYE